MGEAAVVTLERARTGYVEVARIKDPDGILAIVSARVNGPPLVTIAIYKVFERDGVEQKTSFWTVKQTDAVLRVVGIAQQRAREEEDRLRKAYEEACRR